MDMRVSRETGVYMNKERANRVTNVLESRIINIKVQIATAIAERSKKQDALEILNAYISGLDEEIKDCQAAISFILESIDTPPTTTCSGGQGKK
jgi:hypothetical protein